MSGARRAPAVLEVVVSPGLRTAVRGIGQTLITVGAVLLLYVVWSLWFTGIGTARAQSEQYDQLTAEWDAQDPAVPFEEVPLGAGIAIIRIPLFGPSYHPVVLKGTTRDVLREGPGHYVDSALPGQVGNFAVAGHRTTYGAPFNRLDELQPGSPVVIETADHYYTYRVVEQRIVQPTQVDVVAPVPGRPGEVPTEAMLTFTTCHPEYSSRQRLVVHGELEGKRPRGDGPPPVLGEQTGAAAAPTGSAGGA